MKVQFTHKFEDIISVKNLLKAWEEFIPGKRGRKDTRQFSMRLMDNIFLLHRDLYNHTYKHGDYQAFKINDPKPRDIHKATVRDRLLHHAIYRKLYPFFDKTFIADSFSCRLEKGTHKAIGRFLDFFRKASRNNTKNCWVLKCDIRKFFANIDHEILVKILKDYIPDKNILWLLKEIINSFNTEGKDGVGLPLGNLTSQLFVNVYMNKFDQFAKHKLKAKYYIRYADDFVILSPDRIYLENATGEISKFLLEELNLELHPNKIFIKTFSSGVDFLGQVVFPSHKVLRTKTKKRMFKNIKKRRAELESGLISEESFNQSLQSYYGMLTHCNGYKLKRKIDEII